MDEEAGVGAWQYLRQIPEHFRWRDFVHLTSPAAPVVTVLGYGLGLKRRRLEDDLDGRDPAFVRWAMETTRAVARSWFRWRVEGVEHVPAEGAALLVGNHNGGLMPIDTLLTMAAIEDRLGVERVVRPLAHDLVFYDRAAHRAAIKLGLVRAGHSSAHAVFRRGDLALVYPGSDLDTMRPFRERDRVVLGGRTGFVRLALTAGVPIVPVVSAGTHEQLIILSRGERLARALRLDVWARAKVFPIALGLPWGLFPAFFFYLPLPAQTTLAFGEPIAWPDLRPQDADDPAVVQRCYAEVEERMQAMLDRLSRGRIPWLGQR